MSTTQIDIQVELTYTDYTKRNYRIPFKGEVTAENITAAKAAIEAFNTAAGAASSAVAMTFISDDGAVVGGITDATIIQTTEEDIYNA